MEKQDIRQFIDEKLKGSVSSLTEDDAKKIFQLYEIPVVAETVATDPGSVAAACEKTGYPIVLKGLGKSLLHKTEAGLVHVGLSDKSQVARAVEQMRKSAGDKLEAFVVQPVILGKREFVAGMFRDPQFGPVILFGLGGVLTEALDDAVFKIAPIDDADMDDMFEQLSSRKLLEAFRGE